MVKKVILFICVFFFIYPIFPKGFPIPLDRVMQILGFGVLILDRKNLIKLIFSRKIVNFFMVSSVLVFLAYVAQLQNDEGFESYFIKIALDPFFYIFSAFLLFWMFKQCYKNINIGLVVYYIVLAAIFQTLVSFVFFLNKNIFLTYLSLLNPEVNSGIIVRTSLLSKRFIGVGNQFFTGSINYGIAFFSVLILPYVHNNKITRSKLKYWGTVLLIAFGGLMTGRTFFVALAVGILMITMLKSKNILAFIRNNFKIVFGIILSAPILYFILSVFVDTDRLDRTLEFIFQLFINYFSGEGLESHSTNQLLEMYIFPNNMQTWLFGDGQMLKPNGGYYMSTDVGYVRLIYYFGLPCTLFFVWLLFKYSRILSRKIKSVPFKYYFFILSLWFIILNLKGLAFGSEYFVLFLVFSVLIRKNKVIGVSNKF